MKKKILIIEDEVEASGAMKSMLEASGFEVTTAANGEEGLQAARTMVPDLILLDLMLPKMSGFVVTRLLKFDERYSKIPIIILSAKAEDQDFSMGEKVGASGYLMKPVKSGLLLEKIKETLSAAATQ